MRVSTLHRSWRARARPMPCRRKFNATRNHCTRAARSHPPRRHVRCSELYGYYIGFPYTRWRLGQRSTSRMCLDTKTRFLSDLVFHRLASRRVSARLTCACKSSLW
jgi:hypothetical protein